MFEDDVSTIDVPEALETFKKSKGDCTLGVTK